jgi:hypothetical protein
MLTTTIHRVLMAGSLCLGSSAALAQTYTFQYITPPGAVQTDPLAVNDSGEVLGYWYDSSYTRHPFTFQNGTLTSFSFPQGSGIVALGLNNKGDVAGDYTDSSGNEDGFIYTHKGKLITLQLPGASATYVDAINDSDEVAGSGYVNGGISAFVYKDGTYTVFATANYTTPQAINNKGSVTGFVSTNVGVETFFTYENGVFTSTPLPDTYFTAGFAINNHGVVAGQLANDSRQQFGFTLTKGGKEKIIGYPGAASCFLQGINNAGEAVGSYFDSNYNSYAFVYLKGAYTTISDGTNSQFNGVAINASGQVIGNYQDQNGVYQAYLATP